MTTPDVLDGAEIEKIVAGLSADDIEVLTLASSDRYQAAFMLRFDHRGGPAAHSLRAMRRLVDVKMGGSQTLVYRLNSHGKQVRAHLARTRRVVDARSHGGEG